MRIVITGGHHTGAIPVISEIKRRDVDTEIYWFGHKYSAMRDKNPTLEYREITSLGVPFYNLHAGKFYKTYDPIRLLKVPLGFFEALFLLIKLRPDVILSFGGYLAVPTVLAGWLLRIPSVTHEQTVVLGLANRFLSRFVKKILISWPSSARYFPKDKVVFTGLPLRRAIFEKQTNNLNVSSGFPTIYITTGKTGSHKINMAVLGCLYDLLGICNIIHQCGDNSVYSDYHKLAAKYNSYEDRPKGKYFPKKFTSEGEIGEVFSKANLVVSRSGAHITLELLALQKPSLLIPIPWVSRNEQEENANKLVESEIAEILLEKDLDSETLYKKIKQMLVHIDQYKISGEHKKVVKENAATLIVDEIYKEIQN